MSIYLASDNLHITATLEIKPEEGEAYTVSLRWEEKAKSSTDDHVSTQEHVDLSEILKLDYYGNSGYWADSLPTEERQKVRVKTQQIASETLAKSIFVGDLLTEFWDLAAKARNKTILLTVIYSLDHLDNIPWELLGDPLNSFTRKFNFSISVSRGVSIEGVGIPKQKENARPTGNIADQQQIQGTNDYKDMVFVSYAWGGESEQTVDEIEEAFAKHSISIVRDKKDLEYKGSIKEFERRIGEGKCVILVISDKYLRSEHCMYELVEVGKNKNLRERIFPIVLADAHIYKSMDRINYIKYWDEQIQCLDQKIQELTIRANIGSISEDLDNYTLIRASFAYLTDLLRDMNALTPEMHKADDFSIIINSVKRVIKSSRQNSRQSNAISTSFKVSDDNATRVPAKEKIRVAYVSSQPLLYPAIHSGAEAEVIKKVIKDNESIEFIFYPTSDITHFKFHRFLTETKPHILHMALHGERGKFLFSRDSDDQPIPFGTLAKDILDVNSVRLTVLNVCYSSAVRDDDIYLPSLSRQLVEMGMPCSIGMATKITDRAILEFTEWLYMRFSENKTARVAYSSAVEAVRNYNKSDNILWSVPMLYLNQDTMPFVDFLEQILAEPEAPVIDANFFVSVLMACDDYVEGSKNVYPSKSWDGIDWESETSELLSKIGKIQRLFRELEQKIPQTNDLSLGDLFIKIVRAKRDTAVSLSALSDHIKSQFSLSHSCGEKNVTEFHSRLRSALDDVTKLKSKILEVV